MNHVDVDNFDIADDSISNSEGAIATSNDVDAEKFSIDSASEDKVTLAEEEKELLTVCAKRTDEEPTESAGEFLLTREAVVCFVKDSIANAVDRQKRNADKNGRANVLLLMSET